MSAYAHALRRSWFHLSADYRVHERLMQIKESIDLLLGYVHGYDEESFVADDKTVDAVVKRFEWVGECVKRLPVDVRTAYPHVPRREAAAFRDVLVHNYGRVDRRLLWKTIRRDLPEFAEQFRPMLEGWERRNPQ